MTREELKRHCLKQIEGCEMWARYKGEEPHGKVYEEHKLILELLGQEPLEVGKLPPVTQEPKTVLYSGDGYANGYMVYDMAECPNCGYEYEESDKDWGLSFCPNCGQSLNWEIEDQK